MTKQANERKRRRKKGLCAWGGCPVKSETFFCPEHQERQRLSNDLYRQKRKAERDARRSAA